MMYFPKVFLHHLVHPPILNQKLHPLPLILTLRFFSRCTWNILQESDKGADKGTSGDLSLMNFIPIPAVVQVHISINEGAAVRPR